MRSGESFQRGIRPKHRPTQYLGDGARLSYKVVMSGPWDDILEKLDVLERDAARIGKLVTSLSSEIEQALSALAQVRDDLDRTKKQAATLRALSPVRQYARAG